MAIMCRQDCHKVLVGGDIQACIINLMFGAAGISGLANLVKSYEMRTGKPHEMQERRR